MTISRASAALHLMEQAGIVRALGRSPNEGRAFIWQYIRPGSLKFNQPAERHQPKGRPRGICRRRQFGDNVIELSPIELLGDQRKGVYIPTLPDVPPEKKLSERLFDLAIELEAKGL
jgi:hypothetical protein